MEEVVDKDKIKVLLQKGVPIKGISEINSIELMVHQEDLPFAEKILQQREENLSQSES